MTGKRKPSGSVANRNALARLIFTRKRELDLTWKDIAQRGGFGSHSIVYALANKAEHRAMPRSDTLTGLARALDVGLDAVQIAALDAVGYPPPSTGETPTTLEAADDLRAIANVMLRMTPAQRKQVRRVVMAMADPTD